MRNFFPRALRRSPFDIGWPEAEIGEGEIYIRRYPFRHSLVYAGNVTIPASRITSIFSSEDAAFVLDGKEAIFLPHALKEDFRQFAAASAIGDPQLPEVWSLLTNEYLSTEYTAEHEARDDRRLAELGFGKDEALRLKAPIKAAMSVATFFTMEWAGYTTQDVLRALTLCDVWRIGSLPIIGRRLDEGAYWRMMEVALRPYRRSA